MRNKEWKKILLKTTDGLFGTVVDVLLFQTYLLGSSVGMGKTSKSVHEIFDQAHQEFDQMNYRTIKLAFNYLKRQGFLRSFKEPEITAAGKKKLANSIPFYDKKRLWDKSIYLVTYDISERKKILRNKLREFLKTIGGGKLQRSVWLVIYNPQQLIKEFVKENNLEGSIIISCIGKDGYIGEKTLVELISELFKLEELNERYKNFLLEFENKKTNKFEIAVAFYNILKDDPQLPWEILPENWLGDKAYKLFKNKNLK